MATTQTAAVNGSAAPSIQQSIRAISAELGDHFIEREREIPVLLTAALSGECVCFLGIPGVGKSDLMRALAKSLGNARTWERQLNAFSTPEEIVGPWRFTAFERDVQERNTERTILECEFGFVDEVFKGSSAIQNVLLPIQNERVFYNGSTRMELPLQLLVAASNEMPQEDAGLGAAWDRYMLREVVKPIASDANRMKLLRRAATAPVKYKGAAQITLAQWATARDEVRLVKVPDAVLSKVLVIRRTLEEDGIEYGDRRWVKSVDILKARAYMDGAAEVDEEHLEILQSVLWSTMENRSKVQSVIGKHIAPQISRARELADAAIKQAKADNDGSSDKQLKCLTALRTAGKHLNALAGECRKGSRAEAACLGARAEVGALFDQIKGERMKANSDFDA